MDVFEQFIKDLGEHNGKELQVDEAGCCKLIFDEGLTLYLEADKKTGEKLLMICPLGEIPAGSYRRDVFQQALIANAQEAPLYGRFAYSSLLQQLILFDELTRSHHDMDFVSQYLQKFIHRSQQHYEALKDQKAFPSYAPPPESGGGMMGLAL